MRPFSASYALPISVFSAAIATNSATAIDWEIPDVSAYMEIVDDEDLEETEEIPALACMRIARYWEEVTELHSEVAEGVLLG